MNKQSPFPSITKSESSSSYRSRIPGFSRLDAAERAHLLHENGLLTAQEVDYFTHQPSLPLEHAESFIENCVGTFALPMGLATNFSINGEDLLIPMTIEESSVVAAASHGAKLARNLGGFKIKTDAAVATSQIQFTSTNPEIVTHFTRSKQALIEIAESCAPRLLARGGGVVDLELRVLPKAGWYVLHLHVDTCEAMGANIVNTMAEAIGHCLPQCLDGQVGLRILTNLPLRRLTHVSCEISARSLEIAGFSGSDAVSRIVDAYTFADLDPFRAATHNKGIMNGIDAVVIATGNDWRAVNAGCHAYAALSGQYKPLTQWHKNNEGNLVGNLCAPIAVGTVGGVTRTHPMANLSLKILKRPSSRMLSGIIGAVGLAQNLAALRALACEGIQKGHMALHEKNIEMLRRYDDIPIMPLQPTDSRTLPR